MIRHSARSTTWPRESYPGFEVRFRLPFFIHSLVVSANAREAIAAIKQFRAGEAGEVLRPCSPAASTKLVQRDDVISVVAQGRRDW